ncbi:MAG: L-aspartate oxidase [Planctomycetes bacterium]|nr:L-aspartate oxidase [Planctomycetota bacterium]
MPDRYLASFDTLHVSHETADVLVIGAGVAGSTAAIHAARQGRDVLMVSKAELADSNTGWAKGGVAAVMSKDDSFDAHIKDTIVAGDGLCDEKVVRQVVEGAPEAVSFLLECGARLDRDERGELDLGREGGHTNYRILHARGDETGAEVERALLANAQSLPSLRAYRNTFVLDLLNDGGRCHGALVMRHNELHVIWATTTVLASGGAGQLYRDSSNPAVATADGHAMALRAGLKMRDMEMMQFHPTLLYVAGLERTLVTEALRGFGAYLKNSHGERFMVGQHDLAELAPRDVVARAIVREMRKTGDACAFLDVTHVDQTELRRRFPRFIRCCEDAEIDPAKSWIPVRPGPHYMVGGVTTDLDGATLLEGLFVAGEVSSTGLHGANRLASNSLLEGLVAGARVGRAAGKVARNGHKPPRITSERAAQLATRIDFRDLENSIKGSMWRYLGVEREAHGMTELVRQVERWLRQVRERERHYPSEWQLENMLVVGLAMARSALARKETRGVHCRTDFPARDAALAGKHVYLASDRDPWLE